MFCYGCSGEPTVCEHKSASLNLANCLLEEKYIDYSVLHLNDQTCKAEMDNLTHMVTFNFDSDNTCGTVVMVGTLFLVYSQEAAKSLSTLETYCL